VRSRCRWKAPDRQQALASAIRAALIRFLPQVNASGMSRALGQPRANTWHRSFAENDTRAAAGSTGLTVWVFAKSQLARGNRFFDGAEHAKFVPLVLVHLVEIVVNQDAVSRSGDGWFRLALIGDVRRHGCLGVVVGQQHQHFIN
jgi:hypothetical protein